MGPDPSVFGLNIYLLIGFLLALAVGLILVVATWTSVRLWIWHMAERREQERQRRERFRPDGKPYPPASPGLCDRCGRSLAKVYYLPSGERLCPDDYNELHSP